MKCKDLKYRSFRKNKRKVHSISMVPKFMVRKASIKLPKNLNQFNIFQTDIKVFGRKHAYYNFKSSDPSF